MLAHVGQMLSDDLNIGVLVDGLSVMCWCKPCSVSVSIAQVRLGGVLGMRV